MKRLILAATLAILAGCSTQKEPPKPEPVKEEPPKQAEMPKPANVEVTIDGVTGFQDTPLQPDAKWHVHDPARPQPPVVTPGNFSQTAPPPSDAIVLFDGTDLSHWTDRQGNPAPWKIEDGAMVSAKSDIVSTNEFGDIAGASGIPRADARHGRRPGPRQQRRVLHGPV